MIVSILLLTSSLCQGQSTAIWLTYGHDKFVHVPGVAFDQKIHGRLGVHGGGGLYVQSFKMDQTVNVFFNDKVGLFGAHIGPSYRLLKAETHQLTVTAGVAGYIGPQYEILARYEDGGYEVYYNVSTYSPDFGVDIGLWYSHKRLSGLLKFDTARNLLKMGVGIGFGRVKTSE